MESALWVGKTGLNAQQTNVAVISNNLANVSTTAFKRTAPIFEDLMYQNIRQPGAQSTENSIIPTGILEGAGVKLSATQKNFTQGSILNTDGQLDVAIQGQGFFQILLPDGRQVFQRAGNFMLDNQGQIVTPNGYVLQPTITVPEGTVNVTIGQDGIVTATDETGAQQTLGTIQLTNFINPAGLMPLGENLYQETVASGAAVTANPATNGLGTLLQGSLEASNVNAVTELVGLIEAQRSYEMNAKSIETVDSMLQFAVQTL